MASSNSTIEQGVLVRQWTWPLRIAFWWVAIGSCVWCFAVAAQWAWAHRADPDQPQRHAQQVLDQELDALSQVAPGLFNPVRVAAWIGTTLRDWALDSTVGFARTLMNWAVSYREKAEHGRVLTRDPGQQFVTSLAAGGGGLWDMLVLGTYIFAVRTAMYLSALPLVGLLLAIGITDGLVARAKRKACAGRESASLYHRAKLGLSFTAITGYLIWLGLPNLAQPMLVLAAMAIVLALLVRLQCAYYKKYL